MSLTTTTCDDEEEYIVFDQSRYTQILFFVNIFNLFLMPIFSTIDSVTLGRLLFKISRKKNKQKSRTRIRYRLGGRKHFLCAGSWIAAAAQRVWRDLRRKFKWGWKYNKSRARQKGDGLLIKQRNRECSQISFFQALLEFLRKILKCWLLGLLILLFLLFLCSITFQEDHCTYRNRSCALDGYVELSRMG